MWSFEVMKMTALRSEAVSLVENVPEKYLEALVKTLKTFVTDYEEELNIAKWQANPEKYEDEINEYVCGLVKSYRAEQRERKNANNR